jgi:pimeloyl-ACP methyl ester carboxylesterase
MPEQSGIFFTDQGRGFPVILVHGFCETHDIWNAVSKNLSGKFRVLCPDLPGFGKSQSLPENFSITDVGTCMLNWLAALNIESCIVIGHSLGGYVALAMAEQQPDVLKAFGLFHSTAYADGAEKKLSRNKVMEFVAKHGVKPFIESFIPPLFYDQANPHIPAVVALALQTKLETLLSYTAAMRDRPDRTEVLQQFKNPILFIGGEMDGGITPASVQAQAQLASTPVVHILSSIAHMGMFESEGQTVEKMHQFLQEATKKGY